MNGKGDMIDGKATGFVEIHQIGILGGLLLFIVTEGLRRNKTVKVELVWGIDSFGGHHEIVVVLLGEQTRQFRVIH
jgi:hypothetical protein